MNEILVRQDRETTCGNKHNHANNQGTCVFFAHKYHFELRLWVIIEGKDSQCMKGKIQWVNV